MAEHAESGVITPAPDAVEGQEPEIQAESSPAEPVAEKPKEKSDDGFQRRIDELTYLRREAERRDAAKDRQIEALLKQMEAQSQLAKQPPPPQQQRKLADFGYNEDKFYEASRADVQRAAEEQARVFAAKLLAETKAQEEAAAKQASHEKRVAKFVKENPDFDDVVSERLPISKNMAEAIMESDEGPAVAYYLGKNPDIARALYDLGPVQAGREIAKLEERIISERKKAAEKKVTQAPEPTPKIDGANPAPRVTSITDPESDKLTDEQWFALAEKERLKKRAR